MTRKSKKPIPIGEQIREAREGQELRQADLAEMIGCQAQNIGMIERGERTPTLETLCRIADAMGLAVLCEDNVVRLVPRGSVKIKRRK